MRPFEVTHGAVFAIAVPMTLAYISTPLVGIVNLGAVGQLGEAAVVGGVAIGALVYSFVASLFIFLRFSTTGLAAQAYGAGDGAAMNGTFWRALLVAGVLGLAVIVLGDPIFSVALSLVGGSTAVHSAAAEYWGARIFATPFMLANYVIFGWLIGIGRAGQGMVLQIILNGINMALSVLFVMVMGLGVVGVGWASVLAEAAAAIAGFGLVLRALDRSSRTRLADVLSGRELRRLAALNADILIRSLALFCAFAFFTARSAAGGDVVLAANEILMNLVMFAAFFLDGLAAAAEQLSGRAIGSRWRPAFERAVRLTVGWGFAVAAVVSLVLLLGGGAVVDLMTTNAAVRETANAYLFLAALVPVAGTLAYQMDGVFIGATWSGEMRNMMLISLAVYFAVWYVLEGAFGIAGLWCALLIFLSMRGLTLGWRLRSLVGPAFA